MIFSADRKHLMERKGRSESCDIAHFSMDTCTEWRYSFIKHSDPQSLQKHLSQDGLLTRLTRFGADSKLVEVLTTRTHGFSSFFSESGGTKTFSAVASNLCNAI